MNDQEPQETGRAARPQGKRGTITSRPSRESIIRSYNAQDAARARNARMYLQEASQEQQVRAERARTRASQRESLNAYRREEEALRAAQRQAQRDQDAANARSDARSHGMRDQSSRQRTRVRMPLSTQESHEQTKLSREAYERERAHRDVLTRVQENRTANRDIIDARGSIDSRAFNEKNELVGYSIDGRDRPRPAIDASNPKTKWHSHAGQGFNGKPDASTTGPMGFLGRRQGRSDLGSISDAISGKDAYSPRRGGLQGTPVFIKLLVVVIVVLFIVLVWILFF